MLIKVNTVPCPETVHDEDLINILGVYVCVCVCVDLGVEKVNLREPYRQPHIGNLLDSRDQDEA